MGQHHNIAKAHYLLAGFYMIVSALIALIICVDFFMSSDVWPWLFLIMLTSGFSILHYLIYRGAKQKRRWAWFVSLVYAIFMVLDFPIGTIIGMYIFINLSWKE